MSECDSLAHDGSEYGVEFAAVPTQVLLGVRDELVGRGFKVTEEWSKWAPETLLYKLSLREVGYEVFFNSKGGELLLTVQFVAPLHPDLLMKRRTPDYVEGELSPFEPSVVFSEGLEDPGMFDRLFKVLECKV